MKRYFGPFPIPRQHGAWAMFLIPAIMAVIISDRRQWSSIFLIISYILFFLSHQPSNRFLRRWRYRKVIDFQSLSWVTLFAGSGMALIGTLFIYHQQWIAMLFGLVVGIAFFIHIRLTINKEHMSIPGEIVGVFGLTASAPITYLFLHGSLDAKGWVLWMINFLYFTGSIFYVKLKFRLQPSFPEPGLKEKLITGFPVITYSVVILLYLLIVTLIQGYSWFFFWAYVPFFGKVLFGVFNWQDKRSLKTYRFGFTELSHSIIFCTLAVAGFYYTTH